MSRRHVAKMLRRMAEIREKRARSEFLKAQTVLRSKQQERDDWIEEQVTRESDFLESNDALTGAVLGMLDETRVVSIKKVARMDEEIAAVAKQLKKAEIAPPTFMKTMLAAMLLCTCNAMSVLSAAISLPYRLRPSSGAKRARATGRAAATGATATRAGGCGLGW